MVYAKTMWFAVVECRGGCNFVVVSGVLRGLVDWRFRDSGQEGQAQAATGGENAGDFFFGFLVVNISGRAANLA